jgi:hypothetical protein
MYIKTRFFFNIRHITNRAIIFQAMIYSSQWTREGCRSGGAESRSSLAEACVYRSAVMQCEIDAMRIKITFQLSIKRKQFAWFLILQLENADSLRLTTLWETFPSPSFRLPGYRTSSRVTHCFLDVIWQCERELLELSPISTPGV